MRQIKFRAWDKKKLWYFDFTDLLESDQGVFIGNDGPELRDENLIFMQFTGLKDKNGKEIYEGDIVQSNEFDSINKVYFNKGGFMVSSGDAEGNYLGHFNKNIKVIGNIYENPELLK